MCEIAEAADAFLSKWRKARKEHKCGACREKIRKGDTYRYTSGIWDHRPGSIKHCVRCWETLEILIAENYPDPVDLELSCGQTYEGNNPRMLELAFMTPDDGQVSIGAAVKCRIETRSP